MNPRCASAVARRGSPTGTGAPEHKDPRILGWSASVRWCNLGAESPHPNPRQRYSKPMSNVTTASRTTSRRAFARHFAEMVVAMLLGMAVLGGLAVLAFAAAGSSLSDQPGAIQVTLMGLSMTVPMVIWMRHRRHSGSRTAEMAASMLVPSAVAAAVAAAGVLGTGAALAFQHGVMVPAMLAVMLWRYDEYAHSHASRDR